MLFGQNCISLLYSKLAASSLNKNRGIIEKASLYKGNYRKLKHQQQIPNVHNEVYNFDIYKIPNNEN